MIAISGKMAVLQSDGISGSGIAFLCLDSQRFGFMMNSCIVVKMTIYIKISRTVSRKKREKTVAYNDCIKQLNQQTKSFQNDTAFNVCILSVYAFSGN